MWSVRVIGIVRDVVEEHQAGADGVFEIQNVEAGRSLVEAVSIAAHIEAEQATEDEAQGGFV